MYFVQSYYNIFQIFFFAMQRAWAISIVTNILYTEINFFQDKYILPLFQDFIYSFYKALHITPYFTMLIKFHGSLCQPAL